MRAAAIALLLFALGGAAHAQPPCRTLADCDALIRTSPSLAAYERRGLLHLMQRRGLDDLQKAIADFSAAIAIDGARALSMYGRGMARLMAGDAAGQNEMEAAIMLRPDIDAEFKRSDRGVMPLTVRPPDVSELDHLAQVWHQGWHDGHGHIAPAGLVKARTLEQFRARLAAALADTFVIGPKGAPDGFFMLKGDELYQFYVARAARGSGVADALMEAAEAELARRGIATPWLACGIGNDRAARFYDKRGWVNARTQTNRLETPEGVFEIEVWRYEKPPVR